MNEFMHALARRLREARIRAGLSQTEVAQHLQLSRPSVSEIEAGRRKVTAEEIVRFARIYNISVTWLLGLKDKENR